MIHYFRECSVRIDCKPVINLKSLAFYLTGFYLNLFKLNSGLSTHPKDIENYSVFFLGEQIL